MLLILDSQGYFWKNQGSKYGYNSNDQKALKEDSLKHTAWK